MPRKNFSNKKSVSRQVFGQGSSSRAELCWSTGKRRYSSQSAATEAAEVAELQRGAVLAVYKCEFCNTWHLTSREASK